MNRVIIALLLPLLTGGWGAASMGQHSNGSLVTGGGGGGESFSDDFSSAGLTEWTQATGTWTDASGYLTTSAGTSNAILYSTATDTTSQFNKVQIPDYADDMGLVLWGDAASMTNCIWIEIGDGGQYVYIKEKVGNSWYEEAWCEFSPALNEGDYIKATITGTKSSATVVLYDCGSDGTCGTAECTQSALDFSNLPAVGYYVGLWNSTATGDQDFDNWTAGDF